MKIKKKENFPFAQTWTQTSVCVVNRTIVHLKLQTLQLNSCVFGSDLACKPGFVNSVYQKKKSENKNSNDVSH